MGVGTTDYIQRLHGQRLVVVGAIYVGYIGPSIGTGTAVAVCLGWPLDLPPSFVRSAELHTNTTGVHSVAYIGSSSTGGREGCRVGRIRCP